MKRFLFVYVIFCIGILFSVNSHACIGCEPCSKGFTLTYKCCKETNKDDCITKDPTKEGVSCEEKGSNGYTKSVVACCKEYIFGVIKKCVEPKECGFEDCM